jgi:hypothetical protein
VVRCSYSCSEENGSEERSFGGSVLILAGMLISELWGERAPLTVED